MQPLPTKLLRRPRAPGSWAAAAALLCRAACRITLLCSACCVDVAAVAQEPAAPQRSAAEAESAGAAPATNNQPPQEAAVAEPPSTDASDPIRYVGPDTFILKDAEGRLQSMPGMSYEDFMAAWRQLQQLEPPERSPRFTIERIEIVGRATDSHAELQLAATVRLLTDEAVNVPLGLSGAILNGEPEFHRVSEGETAKPATGEPTTEHDRLPRDAYLDFDVQQGGFVARLVGRTHERHRIDLRLLVPLVRDGKGTTLPLAFPRTVSSSLRLDIQQRVVDASVTSGSLVAHETVDNSTRLTVAGAMGAFRLAWQAPGSAAAEFTSVLNAEGAIRVAVDGRSVRSDAQLTVRSSGGTFDRVRVRLPAGAQLIPNPTSDAAAPEPGYRVSVEPPAQTEAVDPNSDRQVVVVELREKQRGPIVIQLTTEQSIGADDTDSLVELSGFEVMGAVRQFGDVALQVAPDWQARWNIGSFVRQVEPGELRSSLQQPSVTAAFQYDRQPWSLAVRVAARRQRVLVTPQYELECGADEARLAVQLAYQVLAARAFEFRVDLQGWELTSDPIESGGLIDAEQVHVTDDDVLVLPLAQSSLRRADVAFRLKRAVGADSQVIRVPLPVPLADSVSPAILSVRPAADIELTPDVANSTALVPQPSSGESNTTVPELRFRVAATDAVFSAATSARPRELTHADTISVFSDGSILRVEQRVAYVVRHQAIRELMWDVPPELAADASRMEVALLPTANGDSESAQAITPLALQPQSAAELPVVPRAAVPMRVSLPQPRIGEFTIRFSFPLAGPGQDRERVSVPLVLPTDGDSTLWRAEVHPAARVVPAIDTSVENSSWTAAERPSADSGGATVTFVAQRPELYLPLSFQPASFNAQSSVTIDRVWLQSWLAHDRRQDRAVFRFRAAAPQVAIELAPQTPTELEVLLDGQVADVASRDAGRIVVNISPAAEQRRATPTQAASLHTLELRYRVPARLALATSHALTPPQMVGSSALAEVYWQVVLPGDTHLIGAPTRLASANQWQWMGLLFGRTATLTQPELETWSGAIPQTAPAQTDNRYLYSGITPLATIELVTAPRWLIVLFASAGVLSLALAGIYLPVLRGPRILSALALALVGLAFVFPDAALLLAQGSLLGIALAALAALLARLLARPVQWVVVPVSAVSRRTTPRPDSMLQPPVATTGSTTPTVTLRMPAPE